MELRELRYFLAVAREENLTRAAEALFVTQPNLTRQMQNLEEELGKPLFVRGGRKLVLTEAGVLLRKRAEEILELYARTEAELAAPAEGLTGDICIGGGESYAVGLIARAATRMREDHPGVRFHITSGDTPDVAERLDKGLFDFGILIEPADLSKYERLRLPLTDTWGVLMRTDCPLAEKERVAPEDLWEKPLIRSKHSLGKSVISEWFRRDERELNIVATYNLVYNASLMVEAGMGYAVGLDKLLPGGREGLCFRPLAPALVTHLDFVWKKYRLLPKPAEEFVSYVREEIALVGGNKK